MLFQENKYDQHTFSDQIRLVDHFFCSSGKKQIYVQGNSKFSYLAVLGPGTNVEIDIQTAGENIQLFLSVIVIPDRFQPTKLHLQSNLLHSHTETNVHIISFLTDTTQAQIDGKVMVAPGIIKASGHLLEENIILGGKVKIQTLPMLDVRSNDVQASHGARIEKLDKKKLFYLQSRGLSDRAAKQLLISGYFETIFGPFIHQAVHDHIHPQLLRLQEQYMDMVIL